MKKIKIIANILALLAILLISGSCKKEPTTKQVTWEYKYEVTGAFNDYNVLFQNTDNSNQQLWSVENGWQYKWNQTLTVDNNNNPLEEQTRWLYFSAQNNNSSGNVTVKIYRNGIVVASNSSSGSWTSATVSGDY